jgi:hypothetical protein
MNREAVKEILEYACLAVCWSFVGWLVWRMATAE